jgi:hypothetical protein
MDGWMEAEKFTVSPQMDKERRQGLVKESRSRVQNIKDVNRYLKAIPRCRPFPLPHESDNNRVPMLPIPRFPKRHALNA